METLIKQGYARPSQIFEDHVNKKIDISKYNTDLGLKIKDIAREKDVLSHGKKAKEKNAEIIDELNAKIKLSQKYRNRRAVIPEGAKTIGTGIYTQQKRNA